jgi:hypothetical protein
VAVEVFVGNPLLTWGRDNPRPIFYPLDNRKFSGKPVSARAFRDITTSLEALGVIRRKAGKNCLTAPRAARFWPTETLLHMAEASGILTSVVRACFGQVRELPAPVVHHPVVLYPMTWNKVAKRKPLSIANHDIHAWLVAEDVREHNGFAATFSVKGCRTPRWRRQFSENWNLHGRWYAVGGGNYQVMPERDRLSAITINGEPVSEIDISASFLSILHARMGLPLPTGDLYAVSESFPRKVIKAWINASISKGSPVTKWSAKTLKSYPETNEFDAKAIGSVVMSRYPLLKDTAGALGVADCGLRVGKGKDEFPRVKVLANRLMNIEADVTTLAMRKLRHQGILSLPMHDGLIVPGSSADACKEAMLTAAREKLGIELRLSMN